MLEASRMVMLGPPRCAGCGARAGWLCPRCRVDARSAPPDVAIKDVARTVATWAYEGGPRSLVLALKVRGLRSAADPLAEALAGSCRAARLSPDVVTWVPARRRDISRRGFDHAEVLARGVARRLGPPCRALLARSGRQPDQAGLDRARRLVNLQDAFKAREPVAGCVLLIDDLLTTGATASACGSALRAGGASEVDVAVVCRA